MGRSIEGMSKVDKKAVCCIVKNEERDFAEWIAFHLQAGFDTIIVYDNMSDDGTRDIVLEFTEKFDVRLVKWKQTAEGRQFTAYSHALAHFGGDFEWILFIDSDEFFIESPDSYKKMSFLDNFDASVSQVLLNWVTFGSSGHKEFPDGLVIENFLYRAPEEKDINKHTKAFVRPGDVLLCNHPHQFSVTGRSVDVFGNDIIWSETHGPGVIAGVPDYSGPRIHHYWTRSEAHWLLKDARQRPDSNRPPLGIEAMRAFDAVCTVRDESALSFAPAVRSALQEIGIDHEKHKQNLLGTTYRSAEMSSQMASLDDIGLVTGTDKSSKHHGYLTFYDQFFNKIRHKSVNILEIGIDKGASLYMWRAYFNNGIINGIDINQETKSLEKERVIIHIGDQTDQKFIETIGQKFGPFDVIIDDGSHIWDHQMTSLRYLYKFLKYDGFYVIEDLQTSFSYHDSYDHFKGNSQESTVEYMHRLSKLIVARHTLAEKDDFFSQYLNTMEFIAFYYGVALIKKKSLIKISNTYGSKTSININNINKLKLNQCIIHNVFNSNFANMMMKFMVAKKVQASAPRAILSNYDMPYWNIHFPNIETKGGRCVKFSHDQRVNTSRVAYLANSGLFDIIEMHGHFQRMENFLDIDEAREIFRPPRPYGASFDEKFILCPVRAAEILGAIHSGYSLIPINFYRDIFEKTKLIPVFCGQTDKNIYIDELRLAFPEAIFLPPQGSIADFETIRNSKNIILPISTFAWMAAWLSHAERIIFPVYGLFNPQQFPDNDLIPLGDPRYHFYQFPIYQAVPVEEFVAAQRQLDGSWYPVDWIGFDKTPIPLPKDFDPDRYLELNPDVREAGADPVRHWQEHGYREGRPYK